MPRRSFILSQDQIAAILHEHYKENDPNIKSPFRLNMHRMGRDSYDYAIHLEGDNVVDNQDEWKKVMWEREMSFLKRVSYGFLFIFSIMGFFFIFLQFQKNYPEYFTWLSGS